MNFGDENPKPKILKKPAAKRVVLSPDEKAMRKALAKEESDQYKKSQSVKIPTIGFDQILWKVKRGLFKEGCTPPKITMSRNGKLCHLVNDKGWCAWESGSFPPPIPK